MMDEAAESTRDGGKKTRRRFRRLWRIVLAAALSFVLLVLLLPTLISYLPTEKIAENIVNQRLNGRLELDGVRVGWIAKTRLGAVRLYDNTGELIFELEGMRTGKGLLGTAFGKSRMGAIDVERVSAHVVRRKDGTINFATLMPAEPAEPAAPVEAGEPFVIPETLENFFPAANIPVDRMDIAVREIEIVYTDQAMEPEQEFRWDESQFSLKWPGGRNPIRAVLAGDLSRAGYTVPAAARFTLRDWTDGETLALATASASANMVLNGEEALSFSATTNETSIDGKLKIPLVPWGKTVEVLFPGIPNPVAQGVSTASVQVDLGSNADLVVISWEAAAEDIAAQGHGRSGSELELPSFSARGTLRIYRDTYKMATLALETESGFHDIDVTSVESRTGYRSRLQGELLLEPLTQFAARTRWYGPRIPLVSGALRLNVYAVSEPLPLSDLTAHLEWEGESLAFETHEFFPAALRPRGERINLKPTSFDLYTTATLGQKKHVLLRADSDLLQLGAEGTLESPENFQADAAVSAPLPALSKYFDETFADLPARITSGALRFDQAVAADAEGYRLAGGASVEPLVVKGESIPAGVFRDSIRSAWNVHLRRDMSRIDAKSFSLGSDYGSVDASGIYTTPATGEWDLGARVLFPAIQERLINPMVRPGLVFTTGTLSMKTSGSIDGRTGSGRLDLSSEDGFRIDSPDFGLSFEQAQASGRMRVASEGEALRARMDGLSAQIDDVYTFEGAVESTLRPNGGEADFHSTQTVNLSGLREELAKALAKRDLGALVLEGSLVASSKGSGGWKTGPAGTTVEPPFSMTNRMRLDAPEITWSKADSSFTLANVQDERTEQVTLRSLAAEAFELSDSGSGAIEEVVLGEMGSLYGLDYTSDFSFSQKEGGHASLDASLSEALLYGERHEVFLPEMRFLADASHDVGSGTSRLKSMRFTMPETLDLAASGGFDQKSRRLEAKTEGRITSLEAIQGFVYTDEGSTPIDLDLEGNWSAAMEADLNALMESLGLQYPGGMDLELEADWKNGRFSFGDEARMDEFQGSVRGEGDGESSRMEATVGIGNSVFRGSEVVYTTDMAMSGAASLGRDGTARLEKAEWDLPALGTSIRAKGEAGDVFGLLEAYLRAASLSDQLGALVSRDWSFETLARQELPSFSIPFPLRDKAGMLSQRLALENAAGQNLRLEFSANSTSATLAWADLARLHRLDGGMALEKRWPVESPEQDDLLTGGGRYSLEEVSISQPAPMTPIRQAVMDMGAAGPDINLGWLLEELLGGTANLSLRAMESGRNIGIQGELLATDLDGARLLSDMDTGGISDTTFNCYGTIQAALTPRPSAVGMAETVSARLQVTDIGSGMLRAFLKAGNTGGRSPGVETTLAALHFSRPDRVLIDMRNGLLTLTVTLRSPGNITYPITVFDKLRVAPLIGPYIPAPADKALELLRLIIDITSTRTKSGLVEQLAPTGDSP